MAKDKLTPAQRAKEWRLKNPDKIKAYKEKNKEKIKETNRRYREKNLDKCRKLVDNWRENNRDRSRQYRRDLHKNHPERTNGAVKKYRESHPKKIKEIHDNAYFGGLREQTLKRDNYTCQKCGLTEEEHRKKWKCSLNVHHKDGKGCGVKDKNNVLDNLISLCKTCHGKEHGRKISHSSSSAKEGEK